MNTGAQVFTAITVNRNEIQADLLNRVMHTGWLFAIYYFISQASLNNLVDKTLRRFIVNRLTDLNNI